MRILIIPFLALGTGSLCSAAKPEVETPAQLADFDVSGKVFNPLEAAAQHANEGGPRTPATAQAVAPAEKSTSEAKNHQDAPKAEQQRPESTNPSGANGSLLPAIPYAATDSLTQIGGIDLNPYNTPLEEVVRHLARYLDRPVNIALVGKYKVTGSWRQSTAIEILRDIVQSQGLVLKETTIAYQLEDHGRNLPIPTAKVRSVSPKPATKALTDSLSESKNSEQSVALQGRSLEKAIQRNDEAREKALERRKQLLENRK